MNSFCPSSKYIYVLTFNQIYSRFTLFIIISFMYLRVIIKLLETGGFFSTNTDFVEFKNESNVQLDTCVHMFAY